MSSLSSLNETIPCIFSSFNSIWSLTSSNSITDFEFCAESFTEDFSGGVALLFPTFVTEHDCSIVSTESSAES